MKFHYVHFNSILFTFSLFLILLSSSVETAAIPGWSGWKDDPGPRPGAGQESEDFKPPGDVRDFLHLKYNSRTCYLGFSTKSRRLTTNPNGVWEGYPIGSYLTGDPLPNNRCYSVESLGSTFVKSISQFALSGYCECRFFEDTECQIGLLEAFNTYQPDLSNPRWENDGAKRSYDDTFGSFSCRWANRLDSFESCQVSMNNGVGKNNRKIWVGLLDGSGYQEQVETFTKADMEGFQDINNEKVNGVSACREVKPGLKIRGWEISGCTCEFFDAENCGGTKIYHRGVPGKDSGSLEGDEDPEARSFRCWVPYGIAWGPEREDSLIAIDGPADEPPAVTSEATTSVIATSVIATTDFPPFPTFTRRPVSSRTSAETSTLTGHLSFPGASPTLGVISTPTEAPSSALYIAAPADPTPTADITLPEAPAITADITLPEAPDLTISTVSSEATISIVARA
ncbi:hypothetical protein TWF281_007035 [Arthrobotrys megalospora]